MFRQHVRDETPLGLKAKSYMDAGELVPDDVVIEMLLDELGRAPNGIVLDGFPRTITHAQALEDALVEIGRPLDAAVKFTLPDEVTVARLAGRRTCCLCERTYNVELAPPRREDICDACGGDLVQRDDDREETVRHRLEVYHRDTEPLVAFYRQRVPVLGVNALGKVEEVTDRTVSVLEDLAGE